MDDVFEVRGPQADRGAGDEEAIFDEDLVEEISIDGMCGVY